ncbi:MAG: Holliday junction resolvase [Candidatus Methanoplasma sp.]|jgi:Holliday junction resolvase|nr:Holliday junction resolvase [Candidatus Methanoplasma sp.]
MAAAGDTYERELKQLLSGEKKTVAKMVKTCDDSESASYGSMLDDPFLVIRAAGSLGVDLVALRWDFSFPIEVKSSAEETLHFSRSARLTEQADRMLDTCCRSGLVPIYAFRLKSVRGDPWRIFTMPLNAPLCGSNAVLWEKLPKFEVTSNGNYIMRWGDGMKLSDLISFFGRAAE